MEAETCIGHSPPDFEPVTDMDTSKRDEVQRLNEMAVEDPYLGVYTTSVSPVPTVCMSTSTSAYTVDSRCELLRKNGRLDELNEDDDGRQWGFGSYRPGYLQGCANIKMFIFHCCMFSTVSGALIAGYVNSVITTIEKRFEMGSSSSGLIPASVEFGSLLAVLFVSYFGGSRHIPLWIGCGALLQGLGAITFTLPHFLTQSYTVTGGLDSNTTNGDNICQVMTSPPAAASLSDHSGNGGLAGGLFKDDSSDRTLTCEEQSLTGGYIELNIVILIVAQAMIGIGGAPLFTLGTTYIDDHVPKEHAPACIALLYATGAFGPVLGFALGSLMLQFYVDYFSFDYHRLHLTPDDPRWVGAWWGGFLICGALLIITSVPFFGFPKVLWREKEKLEKQKENTEILMKGFTDPSTSVDHSRTPDNYGRDIKDLPMSMWRLITNPIYVVTCLGICCEVSIVCGFVVFLPKYLETQFGMSKSFANLLTGGIAIPGAVVGILVGGYLCKRCQLAAKGALQLTLTLNFLALATFGVFFMLGCDNVKMAGATQPYFNSSGQDLFEANLTSMCNLNCDCSPNNLEPVCGINGITYFSPCHAGCTQMYVGNLVHYENYTGCSCILEDMQLPPEVTMSPLASRGACKQTDCDTLLPFMCLLFVMTFVVAGTQMPLLMMTLRSVAEEERAFALGIQFVLLRLFSYIPSPILYGNLIDSTCLLWNMRCGYAGACLLYDIENFRYKYVGISAVLKFMGMVFFVSDWIIVFRNSKVPGPEEGQPVPEVMCTPGSAMLGPQAPSPGAVAIAPDNVNESNV